MGTKNQLMRRNVLDRILCVLAIEPKDHIVIPVTGIFSGKKTNRTQSNFNTFPWRTPIKSTELSHYQLCFKSMVERSGLNKKVDSFFSGVVTRKFFTEYQVQ